MATAAEITRLDRAVDDAQETATAAASQAEKAIFGLSSHEQICALRYASIDEKLKSLKNALYLCLIALAALMKSDKLGELLKLMGFGI